MTHSSARFLVEIDGLTTSTFAEVCGLEAEIQVIEYREGGDKSGHVTKIVKELMHPRDALYYIMTGKPFDAQKAADIKFVTMTVPQTGTSQCATATTTVATCPSSCSMSR